jgi:hypothetical protein
MFLWHLPEMFLFVVATSDGVLRSLTFVPVYLSISVSTGPGIFNSSGTTAIAVASSLVGLLGLMVLLLAALTIYFYRRKAKVLARREAVEGEKD